MGLQLLMALPAAVVSPMAWALRQALQSQARATRLFASAAGTGLALMERSWVARTRRLDAVKVFIVGSVDGEAWFGVWADAGLGCVVI